MRARLSAVLIFGLLSACGGASPSVMEFVEIVPAQPRIGDVTTIRFRLIDERGVPLAGAVVNFKLSSENSGVTLSPTSTVSIRGSGFAETQIIANSRVNSVIIIATSGNKQVVSPPITFAGTSPSGRQLSFGCGPIAGDGSGGRHAIGAFDGTRHLIVGSSIDCAAHVGDRNGDGVVGALVSFMTEAGTIGPSQISVSNLVGDAVVTYKTSEPLPVATDPGTFTWNPTGRDGTEPDFTGEYLAPTWMHPFRWSEDPRQSAIAFITGGGTTVPIYNMNEPRRADPIRIGLDGQHPTNNPRDNLVSMIAVTSGEEGFDDFNNNGVYDPNEIFDDLTEPFVDSNDDGTHQDNERFIDTNGNGKWDGKNGRWDGNTLIWKQERILWTGYFIDEDVLGVPNVPGQKTVVQALGAGGAINLVCPGAGSACPQVNPQTGYTYLADPWFNSMAKNGDSDTCEVLASDMQPVRVISNAGSGFAFTYPAGELITFTVTDTRDPAAPPIEAVPRRVPPLQFRATVSCTYTSSPRDGYELKIAAGTLTGTVE